MIKNERQYYVAKAQLAKFHEAFEAAQIAAANEPDAHPALIKARLEAIESQIDTYDRELREYIELRDHLVTSPSLAFVAVIAENVIKARIGAGLTQKGLADRLGLPEQQIQRYEAGDYEQASLARLIEIADAIEEAKAERCHGIVAPA